MIDNHNNILITGASSGLGAKLAEIYAKPKTNLYLCGRNQANLNRIKEICQQKKANNVSTHSFDVATYDLFPQELIEATSFDIIFANAGIGLDEREINNQHLVLETNLKGVINTFAFFKKNIRKGGKFVIISSLAGYRGFPSAPAYCASKAAVRVYGEALRAAEQDINISVVCPGYINTPMTQTHGDTKLPFLCSAEKAAQYIHNKLEKNPARISFPWQLTWLLWSLQMLPENLVARLIAKFTPS
jgi:short-subunit dehydrogenase